MCYLNWPYYIPMPRVWWIALLLVLLGSLIYLIFRQDIVAFSIISNDCLNAIKINLSNERATTYFFLYCLPDALWYLSLLFFQIPYIHNLRGKVLFGVSAMLPFVLEFLQKSGIIRGTFDWWDILTYIIVLTIILISSWKQKRIFTYLFYN